MGVFRMGVSPKRLDAAHYQHHPEDLAAKAADLFGKHEAVSSQELEVKALTEETSTLVEGVVSKVD